ncbi:MAG: efflux RND transporter periplasmic adaptor subunit [Methylobacteriaceae bacterium]|nr:efflux RND transporter periplasmic adaptor subunit [Methylobacteriaceae bacterium]MCC0002585.1 efflux RND transporter periplasmic adaptor subunit [Methylobacteriaceae bacterium]HPG01880.1 efflux RND transporter periplasmic adaptor subunit [Rhodoblastus sp.]
MKRAIVIVLALVILLGAAGGLGYFQMVMKPAMIKGFIQKAGQPTSSVAATQAKTETWTPTLTAIGSLRATQGVEIAPQVGGVVRAIKFESSQDIQKGALLVEIDDSTEQADLKANQAALRNAQATLDRQSKLVSGGNTTQASLDQATATRDQAAAAVERTKAIIAQKRIVAPFDGRLGIRRIDIGQYVSPGTPLVTLQKLDPIYVDFQAPEQYFARLAVGQTITLTVDAFGGKTFNGKVKFLDARISTDTRNFLVRGEIQNDEKKLLPGMFANVSVSAGSPREVVTLPRTAVVYSLYGDSVYVLKTPAPKPGEAQAAQPQAGVKPSDTLYEVERRFVRVGETHGDRVEIADGVKAGETVVSEGQVKLFPGMRVRIDPKAGLPPMNPMPKL